MQTIYKSTKYPSKSAVEAAVTDARAQLATWQKQCKLYTGYKPPKPTFPDEIQSILDGADWQFKLKTPEQVKAEAEQKDLEASPKYKLAQIEGETQGLIAKYCADQGKNEFYFARLSGKIAMTTATDAEKSAFEGYNSAVEAIIVEQAIKKAAV